MKVDRLHFRYFVLRCLAPFLILLIDPASVWADPYLNATAWNGTANLDWQSGFSDAVTIQANPAGIQIVPDPNNGTRKVLRVTIARRGNYSGVANGLPRAELLFHEPATFAQGFEYLIEWSTYIPRDFEFDSKQMVIISQIHQSARDGGPTVALTLLGTNYYISTRGGPQVQRTTAGAKLCCADDDRGKWVNWTLRYLPDDSGRKSLTQLWKNGESVFRSEHIANAYSGDQRAY
ncbi:heparin lyase I family protein [Paraburkholderia tropica]|uniref:heparin lyase I family protein n=1 Tax=Paraburkholderia tropica TaxID=92647 RepID=UPI002ABD3696|nr:heparin lyase I family protein [Paraburkholderia tropica]